MRLLAENQWRRVVFVEGRYRMQAKARNHHTLPDGALVADFELGRISAVRMIREIKGLPDIYEGCDDDE
jgi:hypothetical protein